MRGRIKRRLVVAGAAVMSGALIAACGSSGPSTSAGTKPVPSAPHVVLAAVEKTAAADSAKLSLDVSTNGLGVSLRADGVVDFANGDSQMTMSFGGGLGSLLGDGVESRVVDGMSYLRLPSGSDAKPWIAVDTKDLGGSPSDSALGLGSQADPAKILAYLEKVSAGVQRVGTEEVRGVETTRYRAQLDLGKAIDNADVPPTLRNAVGELNRQTGTIPVNVWIDGDGLLRRMTIDLDLASFVFGATSGASGHSPTVSLTLDLYDFGTPVHVEAPPPDQVTTLGNGVGGGLGAERQSNASL